MGISDGAEPEKYTAEQLSRIADAILALASVSLSLKDKAWAALPRELRMEYLYSSWIYRDPVFAADVG